MRTYFIIFCLSLTVIEASCDLRSGIAKEDMEKFQSSPTPSISPTPVGTPIAPADIVAVDVSQDGASISIAGNNQKTTKTCNAFNRVMVNGDDNVLTIKGACKQIMINGDRNQVNADASMEFVVNGGSNTVRYERFANGKLPSVVDNSEGNSIEKVSAEPNGPAKSAGKSGK